MTNFWTKLLVNWSHLWTTNQMLLKQVGFFKTRGSRWPQIAHLIFLDWSSQFFFVVFREEFTRISLCLYSARSLHSLITCLLTDQNFKNNSEKVHSRNISMRLFQNLTHSFREDFLGICICSYSQVAAMHQSRVHGRIKITLSRVHGRIKITLTIFERGYSRNISVNWEVEATYSVVLID